MAGYSADLPTTASLMRLAFPIAAAFAALLALAGPAGASEDEQAARFRRDDANGDGFLDSSEREAAVRREFDETDVDHDGFLTIAEYQRWMELHVRGAGGRRIPLPPAATASVARCYFQMVDSNGDGKLSLAEQEAHTARTFRALDRDGDSRLTLAESKGLPDPKVMGPSPVCR